MRNKYEFAKQIKQGRGKGKRGGGYFATEGILGEKAGRYWNSIFFPEEL